MRTFPPKLRLMQKMKIDSDQELETPCDFSPNVEGTVRRLYVRLFGPLPKGTCLLHRCDVLHPIGFRNKCINVRHWWIGTASENVLDCIAKGRFLGGGDRTRWWKRYILKEENEKIV